MTQITDAFRLEGFVEQRKELESLLMSNPRMEKKVQGLIRKVLTEARKSVSQSARNAMGSDPRKAYKAVRMSVYKRILGGNVNILNKRRAGASGNYTPTRSLKSSQRGGNRRLRSGRTNKLESYYGADRAFILRFLSEGTDERFIRFTQDESRARVKRGSRGGNIQKYGKTVNTGSRGRIAARNFFPTSSQQAISRAAEELTHLIDELIKQELG